MREYIHFFEDSSQRDAYENGSDYTEPYVSYTPVINDYEAQFNGGTVAGLTVTKRGDGYLILSDGTLTIMNPEPPIINSNVFYTMMPSSEEPAKVVADPIIDPVDPVIVDPERIFIIEEDLLLTDESTEFTYDSETYYLVSYGMGDWDVFSDSEHTQNEGVLHKNTIVSVPSSKTDFVHYNKKYNVIYINTYKSTTACGAVTGKGYSIRYLTLVGGIPYEEIFEYLLDNDTLVIIDFYDTASNGTIYGIYKKSIDTFTSTYRDYTTSTLSYRTVISQEDYVNFDPEWEFSLIYPSSCMFGGDNEEEFPVIGPAEPIENPGMIIS